MNKAVKLLLTLLVVAAIAVVIVLLADRKDNSNSGTNNTNTTNSNTNESGEVTTITYDGNSFSPANVTVAAGGKLKFVNNSDKTVEPSSDDHPTHTKNTELNVGDVEPGQSKEITVNTKGEWEMHNHYDASQKVTVKVE